MLNRNVQVSRHGAYFGGIHSSRLMDSLEIFTFRFNCAFWNRSKLPELFWNSTGGWHCDNLPVVGSGSQAAGEKKYFERKSLVAVLVLFNVHLFFPGKKKLSPTHLCFASSFERAEQQPVPVSPIPTVCFRCASGGSTTVHPLARDVILSVPPHFSLFCVCVLCRPFFYYNSNMMDHCGAANEIRKSDDSCIQSVAWTWHHRHPPGSSVITTNPVLSTLILCSFSFWTIFDDNFPFVLLDRYLKRQQVASRKLAQICCLRHWLSLAMPKL